MAHKKKAGKEAGKKANAEAVPAASEPAVSGEQSIKKKKDKKEGATPTDAAPAPESKSKVKESKEKPKKAKLVRDSFTMPENEYQMIGEIKKACLSVGVAAKKSEVLRLGIAQVRMLTPPQLQEAFAALPPLKAGRPKKEA